MKLTRSSAPSALAYRLGVIARKTRERSFGEEIDYGLELLKQMDELGFDVHVRDDAPAWR